MKISNLSKNYNAKKVVNSVNLEIKKNKVTSFIGPNGAGKSTVMGMISRLILKDEGEIDFYDLDIAKWNSKELAKKLAILTQANNIQMKLTVYELVAFDYMELNDIKNQYIDELSGGQRQRAFIAMVIAQDTEYVLLDEPTNNLDIYHATKLMRTVRRLCDELGKTVILVLHDINYASFYSDYICAFKDGKIAFYGSANDVITKENLKKVYNVDFEIIIKEGKPLSIYY